VKQRCWCGSDVRGAALYATGLQIPLRVSCAVDLAFKSSRNSPAKANECDVASKFTRFRRGANRTAAQEPASSTVHQVTGSDPSPGARPDADNVIATAVCGSSSEA
jgi:hypothetical protein